MKTFMLDLKVASLPMRLMSIGFNRDNSDKEHLSVQHRHNLFELQYVFKGQCINRIGEKLCPQQQEHVYLIAPGVYHSQKSCSSPFEKMCVIFELPASPPELNKSAEEAVAALGKEKYFSCKSQRITDTLTYLRSAHLDFENRTCGIDEIRIVTELLILQLVQQISRPDISAPKMSSVKIERTYIIDEFFNKNFYRNDGDMLLAKKLEVSIRQLNRILKSLYGCNFREKLKEIRLEIALDLLATDKSISEISEIIGYSCPANFSTFIKNVTGKTPSEIRMLRYARIEDPGHTLI